MLDIVSTHRHTVPHQICISYVLSIAGFFPDSVIFCYSCQYTMEIVLMSVLQHTSVHSSPEEFSFVLHFSLFLIHSPPRRSTHTHIKTQKFIRMKNITTSLCLVGIVCACIQCSDGSVTRWQQSHPATIKGKLVANEKKRT